MVYCKYFIQFIEVQHYLILVHCHHLAIHREIQSLLATHSHAFPILISQEFLSFQHFLSYFLAKTRRKHRPIGLFGCCLRLYERFPGDILKCAFIVTQHGRVGIQRVFFPTSIILRVYSIFRLEYALVLNVLVGEAFVGFKGSFRVVFLFSLEELLRRRVDLGFRLG